MDKETANGKMDDVSAGMNLMRVTLVDDVLKAMLADVNDPTQIYPQCINFEGEEFDIGYTTDNGARVKRVWIDPADINVKYEFVIFDRDWEDDEDQIDNVYDIDDLHDIMTICEKVSEKIYG